MSEEGYNKLLAELKQLESVERPKIVAAIAEARDKGDLSENAEYDAAKEAQGLLEGKINKLKMVIADAKIIDESKLKTDTVQILNKVELKNVKNGNCPRIAWQESGRCCRNQSTPRYHQSGSSKHLILNGRQVPVWGLPYFIFIVMATIFSRIIAGEIPCYKVAEDDKYFAFLDINPLVKGHTLVVPKQEVDYIFDLNDEDLAGMQVFAKKVALAIGKAFPCKKVGMAVLGLEVPHAHIHLIPMQSEKDMLFSNPKLKLTDEEFRAVAEAIRSAF